MCVVVLALSGPPPAQAAGEAVAVFDIDARNVPGMGKLAIRNFTNLLDGVVASSGYATVPRSSLRQQHLTHNINNQASRLDSLAELL